jgi:uncharacterized damage-inducible protein DinB
MIEKKQWFSRKFAPVNDVYLLPNILERLTGTPARLEIKVSKINSAKLTQKPQNKWSIKEEIGHLADLEPLWQQRVDEIFDEKDLSDLINNFATQREMLVQKLQTAEESDLQKSSLHPRLKTNMRLTDLAYFVTEHDDHHLAQISFLNNIIK